MAPQLASLPPMSDPLAGGHRQHLTSTPIKKFSQKNTPRMWAELRRSLRSPEKSSLLTIAGSGVYRNSCPQWHLSFWYNATPSPNRWIPSPKSAFGQA